MPYTELSDFSKELEGIGKIWRYVNFTKYTDLLERKQQFFPSGEILKKIDPYEGHFQKSFFIQPEIVDEWLKQWAEQKDKKARYEDPKTVFINCWHINDEQSDALWKVYTKPEECVAIQTTFDKLKNSFRDYTQRVYARRVKYVDNKKRDTSIDWIQHRFSRKGKSFSYENELRIFVEDPTENLKCVLSDDGKSWIFQSVHNGEIIPITRTENGIYVDVNLCNFIEKVYVSPFSEKWFLDLVKAITKQYGLNPDIVEKSDLYDTPFV